MTPAAQTVQQKGNNLNTSKITLSKSAHPCLHTTYRHTLTLAAFALLSSFSNVAVSGTVHKCLQADGRYEFTDKKCVAAVPVPVQEKPSAPSVADAIAQTHDAAPASAPLEAQPRPAPLSKSNAVPSAPLKNNAPTT
jgi:hypothetical protein